MEDNELVLIKKQTEDNTQEIKEIKKEISTIKQTYNDMDKKIDIMCVKMDNLIESNNKFNMFIENQNSKGNKWIDKIIWCILGALILYVLKTSFGI